MGIYLKTISDLSQAYVAPYITELRYKEPEEETDRGYSQYDCNIKMDPQGEKFSVSVEGGESNLVIEEIRVEESLQGLLPINMKESGAQNIIQHLTSHQAPSTCSIEQGKVKTFDNLHYDYQMNDCEHVVFKDCSQLYESYGLNRVEVTTRQTESSSKVKVTIDSHKYELSFPSSGRQAVIKVDDEEKTYIKRQEYDDRKVKEQKSQSRMIVSSQQLREEEEKSLIQREKTEFAEEKKNYYNEQTTYVTSYQDGVYAVINHAYGISVYSDGKSLEIKTYQHLLRNKACGLCGDLNDESVADVKTPQSCIMSSPSLAALTYMVEDHTCRGMTSQQQEQINSETQQCVKKQDIPTQVSRVSQRQQSQVYSKHLVEERQNKICFSTEQVRVCPSNSDPEEITQKKISFYCLSRDSKSLMMEKMAEQGEYIPYQSYQYPKLPEKYLSTQQML